jgi:hypothetical protein
MGWVDNRCYSFSLDPLIFQNGRFHNLHFQIMHFDNLHFSNHTFPMFAFLKTCIVIVSFLLICWGKGWPSNEVQLSTA